MATSRQKTKANALNTKSTTKQKLFLPSLKLSKPLITVFALVFSLIGGYALYRTFAAGPSVWVSTTGSDSTCVRGDSTRPCASFDRAYALAQLGDIVEVSAGNYAPQIILSKSDKNTNGDLADVVFLPASGANVAVATLNIGSDTSSSNGAKHITVKNIRDHNSNGPDCFWEIQNGANDVTISGADTCNVQIFGSSQITIENSDLGPCVVGNGSDAIDGCSNSKIGNSSNVTFRGNTIHDIVSRNTVTNHIECMFIVSGSGINIQQNKFYGCGVYDIFIQRYDGGEISNLLIENNWFAQSREGEYPNFGPYWDLAIGFSPRARAFTNVTVRNNSFHPRATISIDDDGWGGAYSNFKVTGNIVYKENWSCGNGVTYAYNVYTGSTGCGGIGSKVAAAGYVNDSNDLSLDYHLLPSSAAKDASDPANSPIQDIDSQLRSTAGTPDIGADEYGASGTPTPPPPPPSSVPTVSLSASPFSITSGTSSTLTWNSANATSCTASGVWSGTKAASGNQIVTPTTTSTYSLTCSGSGGSASASTTVNVTTVTPPPPPPSSDGTRPSVPQGLAVTASTTTSISIAWNASTDNVGVAGYKLWNSSTQVGTTPNLSYTFTNLTCNTTYSNLGLQAYDAAGNSSNLAEAIVIPTTTNACAPPPPPPSSAIGDGLTALYYDNKDFSGTTASRIDPTIDFSWGRYYNCRPISGIGCNTFSVRWTGKLLAKSTETYTLTTQSDDGVRLYLDNKLLIDNWTDHSATYNSASVSLIAGSYHSLKLEYYDNKSSATIKLLWSTLTTTQQVIPKSQLFSK